MSKLSQDDIEAGVLAFLFMNAERGGEAVSPMIVSASLGEEFAPARVKFALQALDRRRYVRAIHNYLHGSTYEISESGYRHVEVLEAAHVDPGDMQEPENLTEWRALPDSFVLSDVKRSELVRLLDEAEEQISSLLIGQEERAQARAYIVASRVLSEAPEPPSRLIWELLGRANNIAGVASLLVSIAALIFH